MAHPSSSATTTVAILGTNALSEDILARLLEREGYSVRHLELEAHPRIRRLLGSRELLEKLEDPDILLVAPDLKDGARAAFLGAVRSNPKTAAKPVLPLPSALKAALLDELSAGLSWRGLFEELTSQIGEALEGGAATP
jgi:hypothetical protein